MTNWEYMSISLSIGARTIADGFASFYSEVGQAGADGWEAVCEIRVNVQAEIREGTDQRLFAGRQGCVAARTSLTRPFSDATN